MDKLYVLKLVEEGVPLYMPKAPQRLALALSLYAYIIHKDSYICASPVIKTIIEKTLDRAEKDRVYSCNECPLNSEKKGIILWCDNRPKNLLIVAGTILRNWRKLGLLRLDARSIDANLYLIEFVDKHNALPRREYVEIRGLELLHPIEEPCSNEIMNLLHEYYGSGAIELREAVEIVSLNLKIPKTIARSKLIELAEKGCIKTKGRYVEIY